MKKRIALIVLVISVMCTAMCSAESRIDPDTIAVGDIVTFGRYEQDNIDANGREPIEWIVLDVQDGKALLLSKYGLDAKPYNQVFKDVTWETCMLRTWLNDGFLNQAFNAEEQSAILVTDLDNSDVWVWEWFDNYNQTDGGADTQDRIFLLSGTEAKKYLGMNPHGHNESGNIRIRVAPTEYAINNGTSTSDEYLTAEGKATAWWWLRSPGGYQSNAAMVAYDGDLFYIGVHHSFGVVRPAFWLDLESDIF